jgi:hypothetical protein
VDPEAHGVSDLPAYALRLTFEYSRTDVRLVGSQRAEMLAPAGETERIEEGQAGSWVELRDANEQVLYQRTLHKPIRFEMEAVDSESGTMRWYTIDQPTGVFELLVPDIPEAETVSVYASPADAASEPAGEVVRLTWAEAAPDLGGER